MAEVNADPEAIVCAGSSLSGTSKMIEDVSDEEKGKIAEAEERIGKKRDEQTNKLSLAREKLDANMANYKAALDALARAEEQAAEEGGPPVPSQLYVEVQNAEKEVQRGIAKINCLENTLSTIENAGAKFRMETSDFESQFRNMSDEYNSKMMEIVKNLNDYADTIQKSDRELRGESGTSSHGASSRGGSNSSSSRSESKTSSSKKSRSTTSQSSPDKSQSEINTSEESQQKIPLGKPDSISNDDKKNIERYKCDPPLELPPGMKVGEYGELVATKMLEDNDWGVMIPIKNSRDNGVDIIARHKSDGHLGIFEVKTSGVGKVGNLSERQRDMDWFLNDVLTNAANGEGPYKSIDSDVKSKAKELLDEYQSNPNAVLGGDIGDGITGMAIGVDIKNNEINVSRWGRSFDGK